VIVCRYLFDKEVEAHDHSRRRVIHRPEGVRGVIHRGEVELAEGGGSY
jgi:hypothetical protein